MMKTIFKNPTTYIKTSFFSFLMLAFFSCSKSDNNDKPAPIEEEKIKITATQVTTAPRNPAIGNQFKMCVDQSLRDIFTFDRDNKKFMSYNIEENKWTNLAYGGQLEFAGYGGKMMGNTRDGRIYYMESAKQIYNTHHYLKILERDSWEPTANINDAFAAGEAGCALDNGNGNIYSAGGRMTGKQATSDIRKYNMIDNTWTKVGNMPNELGDANAIISNKKLFILGVGSGGSQMVGYIFHTEELTVKRWTLPTDFPNDIASGTHQMAVYGNNNFLFFYPYGSSKKTLYIYDLNKEKWETPALIEGDFLTSNYVNLFARGHSLYAAGAKDGNFALYKLEVTVSP